MSDNRNGIILVSDGKPGGVAEMHLVSKGDDKFGDIAKQHGFSVSDLKIQTDDGTKKHELDVSSNNVRKKEKKPKKGKAK